jgi:hypothetical protein
MIGIEFAAQFITYPARISVQSDGTSSECAEENDDHDQRQLNSIHFPVRAGIATSQNALQAILFDQPRLGYLQKTARLGSTLFSTEQLLIHHTANRPE